MPSRPFLGFLVSASLCVSGPALAQGLENPPPQPATLPSLPATAPPTAPATATATAPPTAPATAPLPPPPTIESVNYPSSYRHDGFYLRSSSGVGYGSVFGDGPLGSASISGASSGGRLSIGGTIAPGVALAGTIGMVSTSANFHGGPFANASVTTASGRMRAASADANASTAELGLLVDWFPNPADGWHAGASMGLGVPAVTNQADGSAIAGVGFAGTLFGGYDWWIGRSWSLGLAGIATGCTGAKMTDTDRNDSGYRLSALSIGLEGSLLYY